MAADCRRYGVGAGFLRICDADGGLEGRRYGVGAMFVHGTVPGSYSQYMWRQIAAATGSARCLFTGRIRVRIRNICGGRLTPLRWRRDAVHGTNPGSYSQYMWRQIDAATKWARCCSRDESGFVFAIHVAASAPPKNGGCEDSPLWFSSQPLLMSFTIRQSFAYVRSGASGVIVFLTISWPFLIAKMFQYLSAI